MHIFLRGGEYATYVPCMSTPLRATSRDYCC